ncbi:MAG: hypothetical protein AAF658_03205 [Myxococcota bacterium]
MSATEHTHTQEDGTTVVHSHEGGDKEHHHSEPAAGEHVHELPDGTKVVHQHDGGSADHSH